MTHFSVLVTRQTRYKVQYCAASTTTGLAIVKLRASQISSIIVIKQQGVGCTESESNGIQSFYFPPNRSLLETSLTIYFTENL